MIRKEAIEVCLSVIKNKPIISANGFISRDLFNASDKKIYTGDVTAVANKMLVFSDSGIEKEINIFDWSMKNSQLVDKISISYKGSGTSKYIKMGLSSGKEYHNPSMLHEQVQTTLDDIIYTELRNFEESLYRLDEGFFDKIKSGVGSFVSAVKNLMEKLYTTIIEKFIKKIIEWAKSGFTYMLEILGFSVIGDTSIATPSW